MILIRPGDKIYANKFGMEQAMWLQRVIHLDPRPRGFHLITHILQQELPEIAEYRVGLLHVFVRHTSASLCVNENADPTVRSDLEAYFSVSVPENAPYFQHTLEGPDDMPAHIKSAMLGSSISLPISNGELNLGTWQGVYFGEHRDHGGPRSLVATLCGDCAIASAT